MKSYVLIINSANDIFSEIIANKEVSLFLETDKELNAEDRVLGYVSQPINEFRSVFEMTRKNTADHIFARKILDVGKGIDVKEYAELDTAIETAIAGGRDIVEIGNELFDSITQNLVSQINKQYGNPALQQDGDEKDALPDRKPRSRKIYPLNQILYGAPGTGKTFASAEYAMAILENRVINKAKVDDASRKVLMAKYKAMVKAGRITFTTFHQSYGYEDFVQGLRPDTGSGRMAFNAVNGVFKKIADRAMQDAENDYVIIIDEINRANISKVFGELITLIEEDKRWGETNEVSVTLPYGEQFAIPNNLYILGTMNSADKSISLIDAALRRRFQFVEVVPDAELVSDAEMKAVMIRLNDGLIKALDSTDLLIGHAYFIGKSKNELCSVLNRNIIPLLYEYFYDDRKKVAKLVNEAIEGLDVEIVNSTVGRISVKEK